MPSNRTILRLIALASLGAVAIALVSQHVFDMRPCAWCVFQRLIFLVIAAVATSPMARVGVRVTADGSVGCSTSVCTPGMFGGVQPIMAVPQRQRSVASTRIGHSRMGGVPDITLDSA